MYERQCLYCGKTFIASTSRKRYCSDSCRGKACHERQKERYSGNRTHTTSKAEKASQKAKRAFEEALNARKNSSDPYVRLMYLKATEPYSLAYWECFRECDLMDDSGLTTLVNDIPTSREDFAEAAAYMIGEQGAIYITTERQNRTEENEDQNYGK